MRATSKLLALAFTAALQPAMAGTVFLDFEDVQVVEKLTNRYSALGVDVTGDAFTATSKACKYGANATPGKVGFSVRAAVAQSGWPRIRRMRPRAMTSP